MASSSRSTMFPRKATKRSSEAEIEEILQIVFSDLSCVDARVHSSSVKSQYTRQSSQKSAANRDKDENPNQRATTGRNRLITNTRPMSYKKPKPMETVKEKQESKKTKVLSRPNSAMAKLDEKPGSSSRKTSLKDQTQISNRPRWR